MHWRGGVGPMYARSRAYNSLFSASPLLSSRIFLARRICIHKLPVNNTGYTRIIAALCVQQQRWRHRRRPVRRPADLDTDIEGARERENGRKEAKGGKGRPCARVCNTGAERPVRARGRDARDATRTTRDPPRRAALLRAAAADIPDYWRREQARDQEEERKKVTHVIKLRRTSEYPGFRNRFLSKVRERTRQLTLHLCLGRTDRQRIGEGEIGRSGECESDEEVWGKTKKGKGLERESRIYIVFSTTKSTENMTRMSTQIHLIPTHGLQFTFNYNI